jgi:hypothetical protein
MKLRVVSVCWNEREMLHFYLRHYEQCADEIVLYDDQSDDGTRAIAACCPRVTLRTWPFPSGLRDHDMMSLWRAAMQDAQRDGFDWIAMPDIDEILWHPQGLRAACARADERGYEVIASSGWNMTGDGLPKDDGQSQIYDLLQTGVRAPVYSKPIIVKPGAEISWNLGRHALENCSPRVSSPMVKLLHYRYLGHVYTARRNARNYERVGPDKGCAWSNAPDYHGEHSAKWAEFAKSVSLNALSEPL